MVLDKSGNPKNLLKSFFFAWATVGERQFLLTYTEKKVLGIDHIAQLTDIQEQKINEKEGNRTDTFEIPKAEKRGIKKQLNQLGYFPVVDYARTAKAAILAKTVESLEIPFKKPKMPAHLQQYTKRVRNLVPGLGRYPSEAEALKIARKKAKEIKDITEKTPFHRRTG